MSAKKLTSQNYREVLAGINQPIVGVGVTAFNRIGLALLNPNVELVCYKNSSDLEEIEKRVKVVSIQRDLLTGGDLERQNTLAILEHVKVKQYLKSLGKPWLFVYRTTEGIDKVVDELGLKLLANRSEVRDRYEDKKEFFRIGREIGLPMISGEQWQLVDLKRVGYEELVQRLGNRLVMQLTDYNLGGGAGTVFVNSPDDYRRFWEEVERRQGKKDLTGVNITRFVEGVSGSITGCVTKHGVLCGVVQTQVVDVPELPKDKARNGVFQGHDWSYGWYSERVQKRAEDIAIRLGEYMARHGYRGVFGVDLIIDVEKSEVYPVECNPRYTGAFPVYTMLQIEAEEIPVDVFQLLEFLGVEYEMGVQEVNQSWKTPKNGAHLVLNSPLSDRWGRVVEVPKAGVFRLERGKLVRVREGVTLDAVGDESEFVLTDGVPLVGQRVKPGLRLGKLMFKRGVLDKPGVLNDYAREVVEVVYRNYKLEEER